MKSSVFTIILAACASLAYGQQLTPVDSFVPTVSRYHGTPPPSIQCLEHQLALDDVNNAVYFCNLSGFWQAYQVQSGLADPGASGIVYRISVGLTRPATNADVIALFSSCSGTQYLGADGVCHTPAAGGGLADPGSNGIIKRTALNVTTIAASADIVGLFSGCSGTQYLGADGACHTASGSGTVTGTGTANTSAIWTGASSLGNGSTNDNGTSSITTLSVVHQPTACSGGTGGAPAGAMPLIPGCVGLRLDANPGSGTTVGISSGLWIRNFANSATAAMMIGVAAGVGNNSAATDLRGMYAEAFPQFASAVTTSTGLFAVSEDVGPTTVTNNRAVYGVSGTRGSTVTNDAALYADSPSVSGGGVLTHHYGLFLADQTLGGANNPDPWGIYEAGTAKNQLGGPLTLSGGARTGASGQTDTAGQCTLGTNCVVTFTGTYATAPICVATDTTAIAATKVVVSTTTLTVTGTGTDLIDYICVGRT